MTGQGTPLGGATPAADVAERLRETAFAVVLTEARAATAGELGALAGSDPGPLLDSLARQGRIDRALDGSVTGSAGLSLTHGPHRLLLEDREYRTWCAYDAIGIPAALAVAARITTACGICSREIALAMADGRPAKTGPEVLWLAFDSDDLRAGFCTPTVILCGRAHGRAWAARHAKRGILVSLDDAAERGALAWAGYAAAARRLGRVEFVGGPQDGTTETRYSLPDELRKRGGHYARSVRCADDGAMRYVWRPSETANSPSSKRRDRRV